MKKRGIFLAVLMISLGLSACKAVNTKTEESVQMESAADNTMENQQEETTEKEEEMSQDTAENQETDTKAQGTSSGLDNFDADMEEVTAYARAIQEAVVQKDMEMLADLTGFPVYVGLEGVDVVETREDFLALNTEAVFSEEMISAIEKADLSDLTPSRAGFVLMDYEEDGSPAIIFGLVDGEFRITGINY